MRRTFSFFRSVANLEKKKQPSRFGTGVETDTIRYAAAHTSYLYKVDQ